LEHLKRYENTVSQIEPLILPETVKKTSLSNAFNTPFKPQNIRVDMQQDDFEFAFNKNFIYGVSYGNVLHEAVENLPHRLWEDNDLALYPKSTQKILKKYNQHALTQKIYGFDIIEHEMPFIYMDEDVPKQGIIDLYALNEHEIILVDFKSDRVDAVTLLNRYQKQIQTYKKALEEAYPGLKVHAYIYSFNLGDYIPCTD